MYILKTHILKRLVTGLVSILLLAAVGIAQDDEYTTRPAESNSEKPPKESSKFSWDKVQVGGGLGLQFGSTTVVNLSPTFGYQLTEMLVAGFGVTYLYFGIPAYDYSSSVYGGGPFARYVVLEDLFAHVEYQILNSETYLVDQQNRIVAQFRENVHYFWVGAGYMLSMGGNASLMVMALYDLNESPGYIYSTNPILRMGISVGL
ncbi:MAG: hypothetical protein JKX73_05860 [Flavobacteriales bacterium]|nr:hypothetical protein [Flavobacteriales bacterium]